MISEHLTEEDIDAIRAVQYCCSDDEARPQLTMVQLCDGYALGTDSYRLAVAELPDFAASPIPKWVSPLALPDQGGCRFDYELVDVKPDVTLTTTRAINGKPWPFEPVNKIDPWQLVTGNVLCARLTVGATARAAVIAQLAAWRKDKTLNGFDGVAISRTDKAVQLTTKQHATVIDDDLETCPHRPDMPLQFNGRYFSDLLRYAPPGDVELQCQGMRTQGVVRYGVGPAVIQTDDEIHALMPILTKYDVRWNGSELTKQRTPA